MTDESQGFDTLIGSQKGSMIVRRRGHLYVINKKNPRWKGRQG